MVNMSIVNPSHVKRTMWNVRFGTNELAPTKFVWGEGGSAEPSKKTHYHSKDDFLFSNPIKSKIVLVSRLEKLLSFQVPSINLTWEQKIISKYQRHWKNLKTTEDICQTCNVGKFPTRNICQILVSIKYLLEIRKYGHLVQIHWKQAGLRRATLEIPLKVLNTNRLHSNKLIIVCKIGWYRSR